MAKLGRGGAAAAIAAVNAERTESASERLIERDKFSRLAPGGVPLAGALEAARRHLRRAKLTRFYRNWLRKRLPLPTVTLPYLFDEEIGPASVATMAARLAAA